MRENKAMGLIIPGGENSLMGALLDGRTLGAIPFGGRYRLIDFVLSNMVHAGIWDVGVVTRDKYESLMDHLGSGRDWDLSRKDGGLTLLPPYVTSSGSEAYRGELEALVTYKNYLHNVQARYVVLSTADIVGTLDLDAMVERHAVSGADLTVVYSRVDAPRDYFESSVAFTLGSDDRVTDVTVGAPWAGPCNRYLDILIAEKEKLLTLVEELAAHNRYRLSRDLLQSKCDVLDIRAIRFDGYCVKIQNLESYYRASMDLLRPQVRHELFHPSTPVFTRVRDEVPAKYGLSSSVKNCLLADGCQIDGEAENCILFRGVKIGKGAVVRDSIIMQGTEIAPRARLSCVIADRRCYIKEDRVLSGFSSFPVVISKESIV